MEHSVDLHWTRNLNSESLSGIGLYQPHKTSYKPYSNTLATALHLLLSILRTKCVLSFYDTATWYPWTPSFRTQVVLGQFGKKHLGSLHNLLTVHLPGNWNIYEKEQRDKITFFRHTTYQPQSDKPVHQFPAPGDTWAGLKHILSLLMFNNLRNAWRVHTFIWDTKRYRNTLMGLDCYS